jgi:hypothetical protein
MGEIELAGQVLLTAGALYTFFKVWVRKNNQKPIKFLSQLEADIEREIQKVNDFQDSEKYRNLTTALGLLRAIDYKNRYIDPKDMALAYTIYKKYEIGSIIEHSRIPI